MKMCVRTARVSRINHYTFRDQRKLGYVSVHMATPGLIQNSCEYPELSINVLHKSFCLDRVVTGGWYFVSVVACAQFVMPQRTLESRQQKRSRDLGVHDYPVSPESQEPHGLNSHGVQSQQS